MLDEMGVSLVVISPLLLWCFGMMCLLWYRSSTQVTPILEEVYVQPAE